MKKIIACLPLLSLLLMSCTTFSPIGKDIGLNFPAPNNSVERETGKKIGGHIDGRLFSIDQNTLMPPMPPPTGLVPAVYPIIYVDRRDVAKLWAALFIYVFLDICF